MRQISRDECCEIWKWWVTKFPDLVWIDKIRSIVDDIYIYMYYIINIFVCVCVCV